MTHRLNVLLLVLLTMIGAPYLWLFVLTPTREVRPQSVNMTELRGLAATRLGPRPDGVELTVVGWRLVPANVYAAGAGMKRKLLAAISFRLPVAGSGPVIIDTGMSRKLAAKASFNRFLPSRQAAVDADLRSASLILATSEQPEHLGGLAVFASRPESAVALTRAKLNPDQVPATTADDHIPWPAGLVLRAGIPGQRAVAVAPGVVVIPAPGPSPGSQMIYVHLNDGREYLFAGDIAPFAINFQELRTGSNLLKWFWLPQDRAAVMRWLVTIRALQREAPGLIVLPGHDFEWITDARSKTGARAVEVPGTPAKPAGT